MKVLLSAEAKRDLGRLPTVMKARVQDVFDRLAKWPEVSSVKWLTDKWAGHARIRTGSWRVIFRVEETRIVVARIRPRKDAYK